MHRSLSVVLLAASAVSFSQSSGQARIAVGPNVLVTRDGNVSHVESAVAANPDVKLIAYPGGQPLGNAATYMQAAGKKAGDIINIGFDTSPQIVQGFKDGWVQLTSDQQPFLQGYMPVLSLCQQVVYGLGAINVDTGAGFVTPDNYEAVAALAIEGLR